MAEKNVLSGCYIARISYIHAPPRPSLSLLRISMPYYLVMKKTSPMGESLLRGPLLKGLRVLSRTQAWSMIQTGLFSALSFKHTDSGALSHGMQSTILLILIHGTQRASLSESPKSLISGKGAYLPAINGAGLDCLNTRPKHRIWYATPLCNKPNH